MEDLEIRAEAVGDRDAVRRLHIVAFSTSAEALLVDDLRLKVKPLVSLVALARREVVGHILFSPVTLSGHPELKLMGLAPMAVLPARQGKGIGEALVRTGLAVCESLGVQAVCVLGHTSYYSRFGFLPAAGFGIDSDYQDAGDAFMLTELVTGALRNCSGRIHYDPVFA